MSFNVASLADYTKQEGKALISKQIAKAKTASLIIAGGKLMANIKSSEKIGQLETDAVFQSGGSCGFTPSGTTSFSQREVAVGKVKIEEQLCYADLEAKYTQAMLSAGAKYEDPADFNFAQYWADLKVEKAAEALETAIWQGDTASADDQLNKFDGLIKQITAATDEVDANTAAYFAGGPLLAATGITAANVMDVFDAIYKALPVTIASAPDLATFVGNDVFRTLKLAIRNANYFHYNADGQVDEIRVPGTDLRVISVNGLNGTSKIFSMRISNMVLGTDLVDDFAQFKMWYSQDDDVVKYSNKFKCGVNVAITSEVVKFIPA